MGRSRYSVQRKFEIVLAGLQGEEKIRELCKQHGIDVKTYYPWKRQFLDGARQALEGTPDSQNVREKELKVEKKSGGRSWSQIFPLRNLILKNQR